MQTDADDAVWKRGVLAELKSVAARKWQGDPAAQRSGLFARAAAEIERLTDGEIETLRARNIVRNKGALNSLAFARAVIAADRAKETK